MSELGTLLRKLRGKKSLKEVRQDTNLHNSYIHHLEKGKHPITGNDITPTPKTLRKLANYYNYSYIELMLLVGHLSKDDFLPPPSTT